MLEIYKQIINHPKYEISNLGNVRNKKTGRVRKECLDTDGYKRFILMYFREGKWRSTNLQMHIEVARAFIGDRPEGMLVDHINRNRADSRVSNLRYVTNRQNHHNRVYHSKYGVGVQKVGNRFLVRLYINNKYERLGGYGTQEEANKVVRNKLKEIA